MTENRTVWKSDNQGDKEGTFLQTSRRGGDGLPGEEDMQQGNGWWTQRSGRLWSGMGKAAASSKAAAGRPRDRLHNPEFQHREIKPQTTDRKHLWGLKQQWEKLPASQESSLERTTGS